MDVHWHSVGLYGSDLLMVFFLRQVFLGNRGWIGAARGVCVEMSGFEDLKDLNGQWA